MLRFNRSPLPVEIKVGPLLLRRVLCTTLIGGVRGQGTLQRKFGVERVGTSRWTQGFDFFFHLPSQKWVCQLRSNNFFEQVGPPIRCFAFWDYSLFLDFHVSGAVGACEIGRAEGKRGQCVGAEGCGWRAEEDGDRGSAIDVPRASG